MAVDIHDGKGIRRFISRSLAVTGCPQHAVIGCVDGSGIGKRTILPSSHTGGRRYFLENFQDGLVICRVHGAPDFVSTFTSNPKWPEITEALLLEPGQQPCDRADIIVRVYGLKLSEYIDDIRAGRISGPVKAVLYTIEFQKRGLPHAHILIWQDVDKDRQDLLIGSDAVSTLPIDGATVKDP